MKPGDVVKFVDNSKREFNALVLSVLDHSGRKPALELLYVDDEHRYSMQTRVLHESEVAGKGRCWK